jgi:GT2 family glycosyltransferase
MVQLPRNGGFAYGNNRGIELCRGSRYVLLLNSDTIAHPGVLRYCFDLMEKSPQVGILSCLLRNADGSMQNAARRFPSPWRLAVSALGLPWSLPGLFAGGNTEDPGWDRTTDHRPVDWVGGAFMFIRGSAIERAGMLDEDFFFYGEDIEFCHRVHRAGFEIYYDPGASITHLGGGSSDPQRLAARMRSVMRWKARYLVQRKCYGPLAPAFVRSFDLLGSGLRWLRLWARGRRGTIEYTTQRDVFQLLLRPLGNGGRS